MKRKKPGDIIRYNDGTFAVIGMWGEVITNGYAWVPVDNKPTFFGKSAVKPKKQRFTTKEKRALR